MGKLILKFDESLTKGLTPMIAVSALSHAVLFILIAFISSYRVGTFHLPEPIFTVSLSSFPPLSSGRSSSLSESSLKSGQIKAIEESRASERTTRLPEKERPEPPQKPRQNVPINQAKKNQAFRKAMKRKVLPSLPPSRHSKEFSKGSPEVSGALIQGPGNGTGAISSPWMEPSEYAWYRTILLSKFKENWIQPVLPYRSMKPLRVTVTFIIEKDGSISHLDVEQSSGYAPLDRSAMRAVYDSSPLPPLPSQIAESHIQARFLFELR